MSQTNQAVTSSQKRPYRKGNPLSDAERQRLSSTRRRETHRELKVFIKPEIKEHLAGICKADGITQAEVIEKLIEKEVASRNAL